MVRIERKRLNQWLPWFAWYPVRLTDGAFCGWVWLRYIYRHRHRFVGMIFYKYAIEPNPKDD